MLLCSRVFTVHDKDRDAHLSKEVLILIPIHVLKPHILATGAEGSTE